VGIGYKIDSCDDRAKVTTTTCVADLDGANGRILCYSIRRTPKRPGDVRTVAVEVIVATETTLVDEIGGDRGASAEIDMRRPNSRVNHVSCDVCTAGVVDILVVQR